MKNIERLRVVARIATAITACADNDPLSNVGAVRDLSAMIVLIASMPDPAIEANYKDINAVILKAERLIRDDGREGSKW